MRPNPHSLLKDTNLKSAQLQTVNCTTFDPKTN